MPCFNNDEPDIESEESAVINMFEKNNEVLKIRAKVNDIVCLTVAILYSVATMYLTAHPCFSDKSVIEYSRGSATIMFLILGIGFLVTGVTMLFSLKEHFPNFYYSHRCFLWLACVLLTLPLFLRSGINFA